MNDAQIGKYCDPYLPWQRLDENVICAGKASLGDPLDVLTEVDCLLACHGGRLTLLGQQLIIFVRVTSLAACRVWHACMHKLLTDTS